MKLCTNGHRIADDDLDAVQLEDETWLCSPCVDKLGEVRPFDSELDKLDRFKSYGHNTVKQRVPMTNSFLFPKT